MRAHRFTTAAALASGGLLLSVVAAAPTGAQVPDDDGTADTTHSVAQRNDAIHRSTPATVRQAREELRQDRAQQPRTGYDLSRFVSGDAVYDRLAELEEIAEANGGNRAVGTPGYEASAAYIEAALRKAGYEPERQYFDVEQFSVEDFSLTVPGVTLDPVVMSYSSSTPDDGVTGELVAPADPIGCDAAAWEGVDATGDIAVVSRGACTFAAKALAAGEAGAAGVIIYNNTEGTLNGTLGAPDPASAPAVGVTLAEGQALLEAMAGGPVTATMDLQTKLETIKTFNITAETRAGRADNVVMVGAHLDGVEEGPGINDNGSGSMALLETAVQLARATNQKGAGKGALPLANQVRFAWWGAEELGLLGSTHYVDTMAAEAPDELDAIAAYLNFDMIGSSNYTVGVYDADESTYDAPVEVPAGSEEVESVFTDYLDATGQPWVDSPYSGRSDYQPFIENGIPAGGMFSGADAIKTAEQAAVFGGEAGIQLDPYYHSADDTLANVNAEALDIFVPAIAHAVQALGLSTEAVNGR